MQGYAYILTHPGTPSVFYDHIFSHYRSEIQALISVGNRNKIHCRSTVSVKYRLALFGHYHVDPKENKFVLTMM